jgi:predicted ester cyclase
MVVYAEFEIPADGFRIGRAFRQLPDVEVELERVVPTGDSVIPFIWFKVRTQTTLYRSRRKNGL